MKEITIKWARHLKTNNLIAISIGIVYLWFGSLKFFAGLSPAEELAKNTIHYLTLGLIPDHVSIILLAFGETLIGLMLIFNLYQRTAVILAFLHILCTFTPMIFFPEQSFTEPPFYPTLLGQYIAKNIIIIGALITLFRKPK